MFHLDNPSGVTVMPEIPPEQSKIIKYFTDGSGSQGASYPAAYWFNMVQSELINVLNEASIEPSKTEFNQVTKAIKAIFKNELPVASVTQRGIVQLSSLTNSTSKEHAANSFAVKAAYDLAAGKVDSVNGKKGAVTITAADIGSISQVNADNRYLKLTDSPNFVILYPNGTEVEPATITINQRIVINNPFPGYRVMCIPELIDNQGNWCPSVWSSHNASRTWSYGVAVAQVRDSIVAVTGNGSLLDMNYTPNFTEFTNFLISTKFRLIVVRIAK